MRQSVNPIFIVFPSSNLHKSKGCIMQTNFQASKKVIVIFFVITQTALKNGIVCPQPRRKQIISDHHDIRLTFKNSNRKLIFFRQGLYKQVTTTTGPTI
jgi:hypothetical protein